jgi:hypothetical protein
LSFTQTKYGELSTFSKEILGFSRKIRSSGKIFKFLLRFTSKLNSDNFDNTKFGSSVFVLSSYSKLWEEPSKFGMPRKKGALFFWFLTSYRAVEKVQNDNFSSA